MKWIGQITYDETSYFREDILIEDDNKLKLGTGGDGEIYVSGDDLYIKNVTSDKDIIFSINDGGDSAEIIRIDGSTSRVGIGTASPAAVLHAYATTGIVSESPSNASITIRRNDNTNYSALLKYHTGNSEKWVAGLSDAGDFTDSTGVEYFIGTAKTAPKFLINSSGNVGIGTVTPSNKLEISEDSSNTAGDGALKISSPSHADHQFSFRLDTTERDLHLDRVYSGTDYTVATFDRSSGNVGIGVTAPASLLHVAGTVQVGVDDAGHDVIFYGDTASYNMMWDASSSRLELTDNVKINFGTGNDLSIYHTGSHSNIEASGTGNLKITQATDDQDLILLCDDGSGGTTAYLTLDGSATRTIFNENAQLVDSKYLYFGTGSDAHVRHDGSNFSLTNTAGNITILNATDDGDIIFQADDGSGGNATYFTLDGGGTPTIEVSVQTNYLATVNLDDNIKLKVGTSNDMEIYHDGSNSYVSNVGTGSLIIQNRQLDQDIILKSDDGSGGETAYLTLDGSAGTIEAAKNITVTKGSATVKVEESGGADVRISAGGSTGYIGTYSNDQLYIMQNSASAITIDTSRNSTFSGGITVGVDDTGHDVKFFGATAGRYLHWDESDDSLKFKDNVKAKFGDGNDLNISHSGSQSEIKNLTGNLIIEQSADDADITFKSDDGSGGTATYFYLDGSATNMKVLKDMRFNDSVDAEFGTSGDFKIYHDGSNTYLEQINSGTGNIVIANANDDADIIFKSDDGSGGTATYFQIDGSSASTLRYTRFPDNSAATFGDGDDFRIYHYNSEQWLDNSTGDWYFRQLANDKDIIFQCDDGSGGVTPYLTLDGSAHDGTYAYTIFPDNSIASFGTGKDLKIFHSGTNSYVQNSTGDLYIKTLADNGDIIFQSDDGSGGETAYLTLDGGLGYTTVQKRMKFDDNTQLQFGNGADLQFYHTGGIGVLYNNTGHFRFRQNSNDGDIDFQCDDGSGGTTSYLVLDGGLGYTTVQKNIRFDDSVEAEFGASGDLHVEHNGTNAIIANSEGDINITNNKNDKDIVLKTDDGSGGTTAYLTLDGSDVSTIVNTIKVLMPNLPTSDPSVAGQLWNSSGDLKISAG